MPVMVIPTPPALPGEDRSFGGGRLYVDLVPTSAWSLNARSLLLPGDWKRLRGIVVERAGTRCEVCASPGSLECHERWLYDDADMQRLRRLIALCPPCHRATHFGFAQLHGWDAAGREHLQRVNHWSALECDDHIADAVATWRLRSARPWTLDVSMLSAAGYRLRALPTSAETSQPEDGRLFATSAPDQSAAATGPPTAH